MQHSGVAASAVQAPDIATELLRIQLWEQATMLRSVIASFSQARQSATAATGPGTTPDGWWGPAQRTYSAGLDQLRGELESAGSHLDAALGETLRALGTLDDRVG